MIGSLLLVHGSDWHIATFGGDAMTCWLWRKPDSRGEPSAGRVYEFTSWPFQFESERKSMNTHNGSITTKVMSKSQLAVLWLGSVMKLPIDRPDAQTMPM